MTVSEIIFAIFITALAVSYGWGMRGCVIGGEKGAMLPGALLGLFLAKFSGMPAVADNAFIFSTVGCLAMGYGGFEPYGQTMEMVISPKSDIYNPRRGYTGLMLKGANWFGICGALLGMSFSAMAGEIYKSWEIIVIFVLIPFIQVLGIRIFNKPYDKADKIYPKIYFSRDRREEWGGNLLTLATLMIAFAVKGDWFSLIFGVAGIVSGAVGWAVSIWLYYITALPRKSGKFIFGKAQANGFIDNWKIMEFSLGFLGGGGLAAYFFLNINTVKELAVKIGENNTTDFFGNAQAAVAWLVFALSALTAVQNFIPKLQGSRLFELWERAVYFAAVPCVVMLGNAQAARLTVFLLILWVLTEKTIFDRKAEKLSVFIKLTYLAIFAVAVVGEIFLKNGYPLLVTLLMYTFYYIIEDVICTVARPLRGKEKSAADKFKGCILTYLWFAVLSVTVIVAVV